MITQQNLKEVLEILGFEALSAGGGESKKLNSKHTNIYTKTINSYIMQVDFAKQKLIYPQGIKIHDATTSNFSHPENFVVFECVHRLLEKGYKAESLELEPRWQLGREAKSGKADILVRDNKNAPYLIIECKTAGETSKSEFSKEWERMQNNGGQLFSYFQQEKATKFLCLYTSDLEAESKNIKYQNYIINMQDNEATLAQSKKKGYKDANSNKEVFQIWSDTYAKEYEKSGIFEDEIAIYNITKLKPKLDNLKPMSQSEIQKKRHEWATILRANAVGDRSLALNGLMNLFLCKITDELENANDLHFNWRGYSRDSAFDLVDRLQKLYKTGMEKYLNQTITYHSKDSIEEAFTSAFEGIVVKEKIQNIFNDLKYFSNGDFNFIEVYNENLFYKNFKILLPIVLKLEDTAFTKNADSNILGDYFESYIHDMPQQEGQYFTPVPLVNFIIHSLPVFKNASVLDFSCGAGHFLTQYAEINKPYKKAKFLGQDKDPRLAKIAKIASFMHSTDMDILANDSFECGIDDSKFNVLISNPPYSVDGFLNVLSDDIRKSYELFNDKLNIESNNAIECFFIEKSSKALQSNGLLSLVLPNSLINKDSIYKATRELLLRDFYIIALVSLGNQTFFKTGTNPIILFALRKAKNTNTKTTQNDIYKDFYKHIVENKLSTLLKAYKSEFLALIQAYCTFREYDKDEFLALLELNLQEDSTLYTNELFKEYANAYKALIQKEKDEYNKKSDKHKAQNPFTPSQSKQEFIRKLEAEKFLYFCYCLDSNPLIIKAPSDNKEQKSFLGYEWSNKKGKQGIQYITASGINAISEILTPLYNPKNRFDSSKLSFYIMQEYLSKLDLKALDNYFQKDIAKEQEIQQDLSPYAFKAKLIDMLDFSKVDFNKAISLNPTNSQGKGKTQNPFENCKFELVKLGEVLKDLGKGKRPASFADFNGEYNFYKSSLEIYKCTAYDFDTEAIIIGDGGTANIHYCKGKFSATDHAYIFERLNDEISLRYIYFVIRNNLNLLQAGFKGIGLQNIAKKFIKEQVKIPLPPLEIQKQIVAECEKVEEQYNTIRMSIEKYQELIKVILVKCGIIANNDEFIGGGGETSRLIASLLDSIQELESKLDFDNNNTLDFKTLLASLPTPPAQGWDTKKLQEIANISRGASPRPINEFLTQDSNGVNWIKIGDVADNAKYITQTKEKITPQGAEKSKFVRIGDFILSNSMSIGRPYILKIDGCIHDGWLLLSNINQAINKEFLYYALISSDTQKQFKEKASGMVVENLKIDLVKSVKIPLPPLEAQEKIVSAIERIELTINVAKERKETFQSKISSYIQNALC
ncbi:restriction endonuclease subunit S [Campylobacter upsaliensis]|uniref:restriction endonuclease subunit S n=1 Tax=Campylobacter upsaliensis TaxID=28080 RepID=UPI0022EA5DCA|nr:restriction endonuclease subunit S [Campylobacter upsaliensis]